MNSQIENKIDALFATKELNVADTTSQNEASLSFEREYLLLRESTIKPIMMAFVEYLARNNLSAEIRHSRSFLGNNVGFAIDNAVPSEAPGITIIFTMHYNGNETGKLHACPHFSVFPRNNHVIVHTHTLSEQSRGGERRYQHKIGRYQVRDLTDFFFRAAIMKFVTQSDLFTRQNKLGIYLNISQLSMPTVLSTCQSDLEL